MKKLFTLFFLAFFILSLFSFAKGQKIKCGDSGSRNKPQIGMVQKFFRPFVKGYSWLFKRNKEIDHDYFANVVNLTLNQTVITANCPMTRNSCPEKPQLINVFTEACDPENDYLLYVYRVSGGKIIGANTSEEKPQIFTTMNGKNTGLGSKVVWDLSGAKPGYYTITAGVDDGCGVCGKTITKEVEVIECPDCK